MQIPHELIEEAVTELVGLMGQLSRRLSAESHFQQLSITQVSIVARLFRGPMSTADLARAESMKPPSMGQALTQLEANGLVIRRPHPTDGRKILFELTAKGQAIRETARITRQEWFATAMEKLDFRQQIALIAAIDPIRAIIES